MINEERRKRRVAAENQRMHRLQSELDRLRLERGLLELERDQRLAEYRYRSSVNSAFSASRRQYRGFLDLVATADHIHSWNEALREQIDRLELQTRSLCTTFSIEAEPPVRLAQAKVNNPVREFVMDPVSVMEEMVLANPLTVAEAEMFVKMSCSEMKQILGCPDWPSQIPQARCVLQREYRVESNTAVLPFFLSNRLPNITADELMEKTWSLLTDVDGYRRIQPQVSQLKVLQQVFDGCCVVGIAVGDQQTSRHSLVLLARAAIHGGRLVTFRSLPLDRTGRQTTAATRQRFIEEETTSRHASTFSWYNFQDRRTPSGDPACEVFFGGVALNDQPEYLRRLYLEIIGGFARWQSAVGATHLLFSGVEVISCLSRVPKMT